MIREVSWSDTKQLWNKGHQQVNGWGVDKQTFCLQSHLLFLVFVSTEDSTITQSSKDLDTL